MSRQNLHEVIWSVQREYPVLTTSISPDGAQVVCGGNDKKVSMLNAHTGEELWTVQREGSVYTTSISPDGAHVVCGGNYNKVSMLNARTGEEVWTERSKDYVTTTSITPDGSRIIYADKDIVYCIRNPLYKGKPTKAAQH